MTKALNKKIDKIRNSRAKSFSDKVTSTMIDDCREHQKETNRLIQEAQNSTGVK